MTTITREQFRQSMQDKSVALRDVDASTRSTLQRADLDRDGKVQGAREVDAAWRTMDGFDTNGSATSMRGAHRGTRAAQAAMSAAKPARGLRDDAATSRDDRAARVQGNESLGRFQGSVGDVRATRGSDGKVKALQFKADMDVDTDGGTSALARSDRHYQSTTSMKLGGKYLDASKLPFVVLPPQLARQTGAKLGDLVEVEQNGKKMYGIYGDNGPRAKIGEASLHMARAFDASAGPNRAARGTFTYTVLPGSGAEAGIRNGGPAVSAAQIQAAGARAFAEARARGVVQ